MFWTCRTCIFWFGLVGEFYFLFRGIIQSSLPNKTWHSANIDNNGYFSPSLIYIPFPRVSAPAWWNRWEDTWSLVPAPELRRNHLIPPPKPTARTPTTATLQTTSTYRKRCSLKRIPAKMTLKRFPAKMTQTPITPSWTVWFPWPIPAPMRTKPSTTFPQTSRWSV